MSDPSRSSSSISARTYSSTSGKQRPRSTSRCGKWHASLDFSQDAKLPNTWRPGAKGRSSSLAPLRAFAARTGATITYKPVLLGGIHQAAGNTSPMDVPAKRNWMLADMEFFAKRYGIAFAHNPHFPINTLNLMRGAIHAQRAGYFHPYAD